MRDRWNINRAGLINFWYYDDEVFDFVDGKLLLRGANGSGKSVTMQSLIPLLLDGNKSPERLDPFGSRARRLEDYLLGEENISGFNERTGYIFIEFKKANTDNHLTIGMGLKARRGQALDFWGFVILDGRRVGEDLFLYKNEVGQDGKMEKVPLTKRELKNRIPPGGEVAEGQREYMALVNKYVFGFDTLDEYDELIKLLIQLRSPKLSKDFKPTVIYEIMDGALPALSDEDLRPLSETIENMDEIKVHLDELYLCHKAASRLKGDYDNYNRFILLGKIEEYFRASDNLKREQNSKDVLLREIQEQEKTIEIMSEKLGQLSAEKKALDEKSEQLRDNDAFKAQKSLQGVRQELYENQSVHIHKKEQLRIKEQRCHEIERQWRDVSSQKEMYDLKLDEILGDMKICADLADFMEHDFSREEMKKKIGMAFDFGFWKSEVKKHRSRLKEAHEALKSVTEENQRYNKALGEQEILQGKRDSFEREVSGWEHQLENVKGEYIERIYKWNGGNLELKLERLELEAISRLALNYGKGTTHDDILTEVRTPYEAKNQELQNYIYGLKHAGSEMQRIYDDKRDELADWQNIKDPEPERDPQVTENRRRLVSRGIPHVPFYRAVEFKKDIDDSTRGQIEAALEDMGIMDALIISPQHWEEALAMDKNMSDKYLLPGIFDLKLNALQYFDIPEISLDGVSREMVDDVLNRILVYDEENSTYVEEDGSYGIGVIKGKGRGNIQSKYIGSESRKRFREEKIASLKLELRGLEDQLNNIDAKIKEYNYRLETLKDEYRSIPSNEDMEAALKAYNTSIFDFEMAVKNLSDQNMVVDSFFESVQKLRGVSREKTRGIGIKADIENYVEALDNFEDYDANLGQLEITYNKRNSSLEKLGMLEINAHHVRGDVQNLTEEVRTIGVRLDQGLAKIRALEEVIQTLGLDKLQEELRHCLKRLDDLPEEIRDCDRTAAVTREQRQNRQQELRDIDDRLIFLEQIYGVYKSGLEDEHKLGFVGDFPAWDERPADEAAMIKFYKDAAMILSPMVERLKTDKEKISNRLIDSFHENHTQLLNYGLSLDYLFEAISEAGFEHLDEDHRKLRRFQITANQQGKRVSLYVLYDTIQRDIAANEALLKETDRQLFEEIIMHNVGKKIRAKIYRAEEWVKKMNRLMSERDSSSGISFSLSWLPIPAEDEQQLDTRELVNILKSGAQMLKPEDFNLVTEHFRSKVDRARRLFDEAVNTETFHLIIKEVLDYRRWFEFRLFFRKEGEHRRELTNPAFDRLSGGEKAMAMYIPLFSAVYARYDSADKGAPRIISLDEAFAGVDDMNIRDMFRLVEDLDFNFIINSQVLWGDYDTVSGLAICELVRPKNANFVTVIRYRWDGKERHLILDYGSEDMIAASGG